MSGEPVQSYATHRRYVPGFHFLTGGILVLNVVWGIYRIYRALRWSHPRFNVVDDVMELLVGVALVLLFLYIREFPLRVQDRVIRLEMQRRLEVVLPVDLRPRIGELSIGQLIALRFATDSELPTLTRKVLDEKIKGREDIKKLIQTWQPDDLRA